MCFICHKRDILNEIAHKEGRGIGIKRMTINAEASMAHDGYDSADTLIMVDMCC